MARIYTPSAPIPAAAVTLATALSGQQHILFTTRYDTQGFHSIKSISNPNTTTSQDQDTTSSLQQLNCQTLPWAIKSCQVTTLRDWSVSQASIILTCNVPNIDSEIPPLPNVQALRGGNYPFLNTEDEIRIYAGYVDSPLTPITGDMLDEIPIDINDDVHKPSTDLKKCLIPIFWGFIDKIDFDGSSRGTGYQIVITCRDRCRIFADTRVLSIPSLGGVLKGAENANTTAANPVGQLWTICRDVAWASTGYIHSVAREGQKKCWKDIICREDPNFPMDNVSSEDYAKVEFYSSYALNNQNRTKAPSITDDIDDPTRWVRRATHKIMDRLSRPRFHMWLQRPPLAKEGGTVQWQILDKAPMEILKWVADKEEYATDFFCSHVNGDFVIGPRMLDVSGFKDPLRMFRTYFFKSYPKTNKEGKALSKPCENQVILSIRTFSSTVGMFTRFIVVDSSSSSGAEASTLQNIQLTMDAIPWPYQGESNIERSVNIPCRTKIVYDGALSTYQNASGGALLSAITSSKIWARDLNGLQITLLGDPTLYPGEAIRVYNTILHDVGIRTEKGVIDAQVERAKKYDEAAEIYNKTTAPSGDFKDTPIKTLTSNESNDAVAQRLRDAGTVPTEKGNLILPVYKIRAINHNILTQGNDAGYTSTVLAVGDV